MMKLRVHAVSRNVNRESGLLCDNLDCNIPLEPPLNTLNMDMSYENGRATVVSHLAVCSQCLDRLQEAEATQSLELVIVEGGPNDHLLGELGNSVNLFEELGNVEATAEMVEVIKTFAKDVVDLGADRVLVIYYPHDHQLWKSPSGTNLLREFTASLMTHCNQKLIVLPSNIRAASMNVSDLLEIRSLVTATIDEMRGAPKTS